MTLESRIRELQDTVRQKTDEFLAYFRSQSDILKTTVFDVLDRMTNLETTNTKFRADIDARVKKSENDVTVAVAQVTKLLSEIDSRVEKAIATRVSQLSERIDEANAAHAKLLDKIPSLISSKNFRTRDVGGDNLFFKNAGSNFIGSFGGFASISPAKRVTLMVNMGPNSGFTPSDSNRTVTVEIPKNAEFEFRSIPPVDQSEPLNPSLPPGAALAIPFGTWRCHWWGIVVVKCSNAKDYMAMAGLFTDGVGRIFLGVDVGTEGVGKTVTNFMFMAEYTTSEVLDYGL